MAIKCKRIIDGKTYNTETATQIVGGDSDTGFSYRGAYLYQTRFGAFFLYWFDDQEGEGITPWSPEQAREWLEKYYPHRLGPH